MPKSKNAPALFEVLEKGTAPGTPKLGIPGPPPLLLGRSKPPKAAPPPAKDPPRPKVQEDTALKIPGKAASRGSSAGSERGGTGFFEYDGERIRLSLTTLGATALISTLVILVAGTYEIGRERGFNVGHREGKAWFQADAMDDIEAARAGPAQSGVIGSLLTESNGASDPAGDPSTELVQAELGSFGGAVPTTPVWVRGNTYILVQNFLPSSGRDVDRAKEYLAQHGVETSIIGQPGSHRQLVTTQGYNHRDADQKALNEKLRQRVHAIGDKYFSAGGGYKLEGYFKTLTKDSW